MRYVTTTRGIARERDVETLELLDLPHPDIGALLRAGDGNLLAQAAATSEVQIAEATLVAPLPRPGKVVFVGLNYPSHAVEYAEDPEVGGHPVAAPRRAAFFLAPGSAVIGPGEAIVLPMAFPEQVDYEGELAVVVGQPAKDLEPTEAASCIAGFTVANDVTARDLQLKAINSGRLDIALTKSFDTFKPIGPAFVPASDIGTNPSLRLRTWVNEELRQDDLTSETYFTVPELVSQISKHLTLEPGDVVLTGSPRGSGMFSGRRFLRDGDEVTVEIEQLGRLSNPVRA